MKSISVNLKSSKYNIDIENGLLDDVESVRAAVQSAYNNRFDQLKTIHQQL